MDKFLKGKDAFINGFAVGILASLVGVGIAFTLLVLKKVITE